VALTLKLTGSAILVRIQGVNPDTDCTITCSGGSSFCTLSSLTCAMGDLASGAQRALTVTVQPTTAGTLRAMASVEADAPDDPDATDNAKTATTTVTK
jgi:cobalamin biosynthesis protein CbiD